MKVVIRLLDQHLTLLAACVHDAAVRGDGCLRASAPIVVLPEATGKPDVISVHWADVNVETRVSADFLPTVHIGQPVPLYPFNAVLMKAGEPAGGLPPVTVGSASVQVPVGTLGARGSI